MAFVMRERLQWDDMTTSGSPFSSPANYKILYNDWPYGIDDKIVHIVVWTKFSIEEDSTTGDLTPKSWEEIDGFVKDTFCARVSPDDVGSTLSRCYKLRS